MKILHSHWLKRKCFLVCISFGNCSVSKALVLRPISWSFTWYMLSSIFSQRSKQTPKLNYGSLLEQFPFLSYSAPQIPIFVFSTRLFWSAWDSPPHSIVQKSVSRPTLTISPSPTSPKNSQGAYRAHHTYFPSLGDYSPILPVVQYLKTILGILSSFITAGGLAPSQFCHHDWKLLW